MKMIDLNAGNKRIRPVTYGLALYFLLMATDSFPLGAVGSLLRIVAFIPLGLSLLDIRQMRIRFNPLMVFQILFFLLAVLSVFYSVLQSRTVSSIVTLALNLALVFVLGSVQRYSEAEVNLLYKAMLYGSWLTVLLMLAFSHISSDGRLSLQLGEGIQDQNYINGYMLFAFSFHSNAALSERKWRHLIAALLIMGIVLLTGSRGAFVAYVAVALLYLVLMVIGTGKPLRNLVVLMVLVIMASCFIELVLEQMPESVSERFSWDFIMQHGTTGRTRVWRHFWEHFCDDSIMRMLFGHGYGTSGTVNQLNDLVAHNLYLDNLITLGIVGLILQILTQGYVFCELVRQKSTVVLGTYIGLLAMCLSLSLVAYKPIWNIMLFTLIMRYCMNEKR